MDYRLCLGTLLPVGVDVTHDIMTHLALTRLGNVKINVVGVRFKLCYLFIGYIKPQLFFCACKGDPQATPCAEFEIIRKYRLHLRACVSC